jgi:hypothetical protein
MIRHTSNSTLPVASPSGSQTQPPLLSQVQDAYFDYDKSDIRADARDALTADAAVRQSSPTLYPPATVFATSSPGTWDPDRIVYDPVAHRVFSWPVTGATTTPATPTQADVKGQQALVIAKAFLTLAVDDDRN